MLYQFLNKVVSPVYSVRNQKDIVLRGYRKGDIVLELGSGPQPKKGKAINIDIFPYKGVDLIADLNQLPFADDTVDCIVHESVLEHVPDPNAAVEEMNRVLKPGGQVYCSIPFMQGYHEAPGDYTRWSIEGIRHLFKDFAEIEAGVKCGPTSSFLWIFQEWVALLLSFNNRYLYRFFLIVSMLLTFPIKYLDVVLARYSEAQNIASVCYYWGRKSE